MTDATRSRPRLDPPSGLAPMVSELAAGNIYGPWHATAASQIHAAAIPAYTLTARILHWITAVLIFLMIPLGLVIANDWGGPLQDFLYDLHRSIGALIIPLVFLRVILHWTNPPLRLPDDIPAVQQFVARATHWGLYALLLVQPIVGWMATSAYRAPIMVFGLFELPPICPENRLVSEELYRLHGLIGVAIAGLMAAHISGALYHHFLRKDRVLMRMITG